MINFFELLPNRITRSPIRQQGGIGRVLEVMIFSCRSLLDTLETISNGEFTAFDSRLPTNSCHVLAIITARLLQHASSSDLALAAKEGEITLHNLELAKAQHANTSDLRSVGLDPDLTCKACLNQMGIKWVLPQNLIQLAKLLVMGQAWPADSDEIRYQGLASRFEGLKPTFFRKIIKDYQAEFTQHCITHCTGWQDRIPAIAKAGGSSVSTWGDYLHSAFIRYDSHNRGHLPSLYTMQVALCELMYSDFPILVVHDHYRDSSESLRHTALIEWSGDGWVEVTRPLPESLPVVAFAGFSKGTASSRSPWDAIQKQWLPRFDSLVLACDTHYPHYPNISAQFDSSPVYPKDEGLLKILADHYRIRGVTIAHPLLYCLSHIYLTSGRLITQPHLLPTVTPINAAVSDISPGFTGTSSPLRAIPAPLPVQY